MKCFIRTTVIAAIFVTNALVTKAQVTLVPGETIVLFDFEDGTTQGWFPSSLDDRDGDGQPDGAWTDVANSPDGATEGTGSLTGKTRAVNWQWGIEHNLDSPELRQALAWGGTIFMDFVVPGGTTGYENVFGSVNDGNGGAGWQQGSAWTGGNAGTYTVSWPIAPPLEDNLLNDTDFQMHAGVQTAIADPGNVGQTIYIDNVRIVVGPRPSLADPIDLPLTPLVETVFFDFEDGTTQGWIPATNDDAQAAFTDLANSTVLASEGTGSLTGKTIFIGWGWGLQVQLGDVPGALEAMELGGNLLADFIVPEGTVGLENVFISLNDFGAGGGGWQQGATWTGGNPGVYTVQAEVAPLGAAVPEIFAGVQTGAAGSIDQTVYFDNVRFQAQQVDFVSDWPYESTGGDVSVNVDDQNEISIAYSGDLYASDTIDGTFQILTGAANPYVVPAGQTQQFFIAAGGGEAGNRWLLRDDFEGADMGWTTSGSGPNAWEIGAPILDGSGSAPSGSNVYGTGVSANDLGVNNNVSLFTPPLDLTNALVGSLFFTQLVDVGDAAGDVGTPNENDVVSVYVRDSEGNPIAGLEEPLYSASVYSLNFEWETIEITEDIPPSVYGQIITFEFNLVTDGTTQTPQYGWFIDDVRFADRTPDGL